jgi:hypothetical protein
LSEHTELASQWYYIRNWWKYQHYHDRNAPWIKLHRSTETDPDFQKLAEIDQWRLARLWLVASDMEGRLPRDPAYIAARLRLYHRQSSVDLLARLLGSGLISERDVRGDRRESASPRQRQRQSNQRERQKAAPVAGNGSAKSHGAADGLFSQFWAAWPGNGNEQLARQNWITLDPSPKLAALIVATVKARSSSRSWKRGFAGRAENFIRDHRWTDKVVKSEKEEFDLANMTDEEFATAMADEERKRAERLDHAPRRN